MGRKRLVKLKDLKRRDMYCDCGRMVEVLEKDIVEVQCHFCITKSIPIPKGYTKDIERMEKEEQDLIDNPPPPKKRGRPRKNPVEESVVKVKRKRGRPRKKGNEMTQSKKSKKVGKQKKSTRGRKPTVGAKVLEFINSQKNEVRFEDILKVYSEERNRLGKKSTPVIEKRNCLSTLYILKRDSKIQEIDPKKIYARL